MSHNIPYDIQLEIIKKVPDVKSLIRLRSVSKQWKSFIDSSEFIASYGARDTQPHRLLLRYKDFLCPQFEYISFIDDVTFSQQQHFAPNVSDLVKQLKYSEVIGSSYGLWCLHYYKNSETGMLVIWNPSIRKSVGIVPPRLLNNSPGLTHFGFGVCPLTYDPTIVMMSYSGNLKIKGTVKWHVEVFSLRSKTWKMIPSSNLPRESVTLRPLSLTQVATDRFISWAAYDRIADNDGVSQDKSLILSFDLMTHDFKEVQLPDSIAKQVALYISISKLNESLVVSGYSNDREIMSTVWMMGEEGGAMTSFTKLFTINTPDTSIRNLLGFRKSGEAIMETLKCYELFAALEVYEPCSEHINKIAIYEAKGSLSIFPYKETLLLADHSGGCIFSNDY